MKFTANYTKEQTAKPQFPPRLQFILKPETVEEKALLGAADMMSYINSELQEDGNYIVFFTNEE